MKKAIQRSHLGIISVLLLSGFQVQADERPNFVLVLTDDQSYGLMGVTGNPIAKTPNLDELANEGTLFTNAHITSAICTPSRISILLSQYERRHGVNFNSGTSVSEEAWAKSYPVLMREAGYHTGWIGKNHSPVGNGGYHSGVMEQSFDFWYAGHGHLGFYPKSRHDIFEGAEHDTQVEIVDEGVRAFLGGETRIGTDQIDTTTRFLNERPDDKPFMLSINLNVPHGFSTGRMQQRETDDDIYKSLYRDVDIPLPDHYVAKADIEKPRLPPDLLRVENRQTGYDISDEPESTKEHLTRHYQTMTGIDRMVGNLRDQLEHLGVADNTVIIITSDHGLFMGEHGLGGKALCYEQTTHVPLIVYDPRVDADDVVHRSDALVQSIDLAPMMLAMAGVDIPETFQGEDISPLLDGSRADANRKFTFTENLWSTQFGNPRCEAIQTNDWKYIRYYRNDVFPALKKIEVAEQLGLQLNKMLYAVHDSDIPVYMHNLDASLNGEPAVYEELFDLRNDPDELTNLADDAASRVTLNKMRGAWRDVLQSARGEGFPAVLRYTTESQMEEQGKVQFE